MQSILLPTVLADSPRVMMAILLPAVLAALLAPQGPPPAGAGADDQDLLHRAGETHGRRAPVLMPSV
eukprot:1140117-Prorocentrum_minimum.AAC.1